MDQDPTRPHDRPQPSGAPPPPPPPADEGPVWDPPPPQPGAEAAAPTATGAGPVGPPSPRRRRGAIIAGVVAGVVAIGAAVGAFVFFKLSGTGDVLSRMVPASSEVYVTAFLDPGAGQKVTIGNLVRKFPAVREQLDRGLDSVLNEALANVGLSFTSDVKPWLGSQIAVSADIGAGGESGFVVLVATDDEEAARAALTKAEQGPLGADHVFRTQEHNGVDIRVGEFALAEDGELGTFQLPQRAVAVVDGSVVLAEGPRAIESVKSVIDTAQGRVPSIQTDADYLATVETLPDSPLGLLYVNVRSIGEAFDEQIPAGIGPGGQFEEQLRAALEALRGFGLALTAADDGFLLTTGVSFDPERIPDQPGPPIVIEPHSNTALAFTPADSYGVIALAGVDQFIKSFLAQPELLPPDALLVLDQFGVAEAVETLSGDVALEIGPGAGEVPGGALLLGTDDPAGMQAFLDRILDTIAEDAGSSVGPKRTQEHRGATITSLPVPNLAPTGIEPAYAVVEGMAILGSSPDEVKQAIDAQADGTNISTADRFVRSLAHVDAENVSLFYADVQAILGAARGLLPPDEEVLRNLEPIRATIITATSLENAGVARWFVLIE